MTLAARLTEAAATLHAYLHRMGTVIGAVHASGHRAEPPRRGDPNATGHRAEPTEQGDPNATGHRGEPTGQGDPNATGGRAAATERTHLAVIRLLEPDRAALRLPAEQLAAIFLGMLFGGRGMPGGAETPMETLVDVFLHGVVDTAAAAR